MRLIHITDPHLTCLHGIALGRLRGKRLLGYLSWYRKRRHQHCPDRLAALTAAIAEDRPDRLVITGDLVHVGLPQEIDAARLWLEGLAAMAHILLVPGNHDMYAANSVAAARDLWSPYLWPAGKGAGAQTFPSSVECGRIGLIGLSSACPTPVFSARGRLGDGQRQRLVDCLRRHAEQRRFRCLLIHHPPLPGITSWRRALADAVELESILGQHGAELILHGHLHRNIAYRLGQRTRVFGTAPASSCREQAGAAYRIFEIHDRDPGWRVDMTLKAVNGQGHAYVLQEESWAVPESA